jgi:hypothetical protein
MLPAALPAWNSARFPADWVLCRIFPVGCLGGAGVREGVWRSCADDGLL